MARRRRPDEHTRRQFVQAGLAGVAGWYLPRTPAESVGAQPLTPEDGYKLWLRYAPPGDASARYRRAFTHVVVEGSSATAEIIRKELTSAAEHLLGRAVPTASEIGDGAIIVGTPTNSAAIRQLGWHTDLAKAGPEGYVIRSATRGTRRFLAIASEGEIGSLYGAFHFLRAIQTAQSIDDLRVLERPKIQLRLLNHWDNLDGTIERGYAGSSLWKWAELPDKLRPRYTDYARANASIGINGSVINSVNADVRMLSSEYLAKAAALANVWRPYGVRVYLSANVAAPIRLGRLETADPLNPGVADWWNAKVAEIYKLIPDFGGFTVKANSEGQPGPKDYGRTHAEGANVLADALAPFGGHVIWRAFIYDEDVDPDRAKRAYIEFTRLDGHFRPNVLVQVKNGPIDFQPREPFHPLFGALPRTPLVAEIQPTQEYLGQAKHLVYLGTMWKEFLNADTHARGKGSTVARVVAGEVLPYRVTGLAAVVNPGEDANWCGHHFSQSNWYAAGRLAWNPESSAAQIAEEWIRMTFTNDAQTVQTIRTMMMGSREAFVNYTMPLGLHHLIGGDHYAPMPENSRAPRADWTATYYHQASKDAIGFDRTTKGNRAAAQYFPAVRDTFDSLNACPDEYLLWFHRCAWDYRMRSGRTLWEELCAKYHDGARQAADLQSTWQSLAGRIDPQRHREVANRLAIQVADAARWRDRILAYFQGFSGRRIPPA